MESLIESEIPAAQGGAAPLLINQVMTQVIDFGARWKSHFHLACSDKSRMDLFRDSL